MLEEKQHQHDYIIRNTDTFLEGVITFYLSYVAFNALIDVSLC